MTNTSAADRKSDWYTDDFMRAQGLEMRVVTVGQMVLTLPRVSGAQRGGGGAGSRMLNGGVTAYMFDGVLGYSIMSALRAMPEASRIDLTQLRHFTISLDITYLEAAMGDRFEAHGRTVRVSRTTAFAEGSFLDSTDKVCATAKGIWRVLWPRR